MSNGLVCADIGEIRTYFKTFEFNRTPLCFGPEFRSKQ